MKRRIIRLKEKLSNRGQEKRFPFVRNWEMRFSSSRPKIAALIGVSGSGSHFILHTLHGHPGLLALNEGKLYLDLKHYFESGHYLIEQLRDEELLPRKTTYQDVQWIVLNKPQIAFITDQYLMNREKISTFYCLRNPISLYYSVAPKKREKAKAVYGKSLPDEDILAWLEGELMQSLAAYAQKYDNSRDWAVCLESFSAQTDANLSYFWKRLGLRPVNQIDLKRLTLCENCGHKLRVEQVNIGPREEEGLVCTNCSRVYKGPGGYNYIRKIDPKGLAKWKTNSDSLSRKLRARFANTFGSELFSYFENEKYLNSDGHLQFMEIFDELMASLKRRNC